MSARASIGDFSRTLQTAEDADGVARLLTRAAERVTGLHPDRARLEALAQRYTDYAAALRETAAAPEDQPAADQIGLAL